MDPSQGLFPLPQETQQQQQPQQRPISSQQNVNLFTNVSGGVYGRSKIKQ